MVSALLNSFGAPGRVLDLVLAGELIVSHDDRVLVEWRQVLRKEKFGFSAGDIEVLLGFVEGEGSSVKASPLGIELPDEDDLPFLEVAHAAEATLTTGNTGHYRRSRLLRALRLSCGSSTILTAAVIMESNK
jgi:predicted nucleic acid-binding protein